MSNKDCYFCLQLLGRVCRLNITQLVLFKRGSTSKRPEFEVIVFPNENAAFPIRMGLLSMDSKLHFVGGEKLFRSGDEKLVWLGDVPQFESDQSTFMFNPYVFEPNLDVYTFDPTLRTLYKDDKFPRLSGPKLKPMVVTLGDKRKVYVLSTDPALLFPKAISEPLFEVFDFDSKTWKGLPYPLNERSSPIVSRYAIGRKLYLSTFQLSCVFDADKGEWDYDIPYSFPKLACSLEYNGFLIAVPFSGEHLVAYNLDSFGTTNSSYQRLDQLQEVFKDPFYNSSEEFSLTLLDDRGRMCLLYSGMPFCHLDRLCARVAVFQVSVSNSTGNPVVTAVLEAVEEYDIQDIIVNDGTIYSTFIMYDDLNKDDTEADASFTNSTLSGLDSRGGVGKHAAEFVADADIHKKPKTTLS